VNTLRVGVALPDPPFNAMADGGGLDVDLINAVGANLGERVELAAYAGSDFNGIFDELAGGAYHCVIAGTTVTGARRRLAAFASPYLISGQALAVDTARTLPDVPGRERLERRRILQAAEVPRLLLQVDRPDHPP